MFGRWRRKTPKRKAPQNVKQIEHLFHGIEIKLGTPCCDAARALEGHRFLSTDAPRLPLEDCPRQDKCQCTYRHYSDRRTDLRREWDHGLPERYQESERRSGRGRRITD